MKKGDLSINVMVLIVIALVVLAVVVYLVLNSADIWKKGTNCESNDGICSATGCADVGDGSYSATGGFECPENQICCKKILS